MSKKSYKKKHKKTSKSKKKIDIQAIYQTGLSCFNDDSYHAAVIEWQKIPNKEYTTEITALLAEASYRKGLKFYKQLSEKNQTQSFNQIIASITQAVNLQPQKSIYRFHLGLAYHRFGNYTKAISSYKKAVEIEQTDRYITHLILAYYEQGNITDADDYRQLMEMKNIFLSTIINIIFQKDTSITLSGNSIDTYFLTGLIQCKSKDLKSAIKSFKKVLQLIGNKSVNSEMKNYTYYFLGLIEQNNNNKKNAEKYWGHLLQCNLSGKQLVKNLTNHFIKKGKECAKNNIYQQAIKYWNEAQNLQPQDKIIFQNINIAKFLLANQCALKGDWNVALEFWQASSIKNNINKIQNIALVYDKLDQPREANFKWIEFAAYWKKEYYSNKNNTHLKEYLITAHKHLAKNYQKIGEERRAIKEYENVVHYAPKDTKIHTKLGELLMENGRWNAAIKRFNTILDYEPNNIDTQLNLATAYEQICEEDRALNILFKILSIEPNNSLIKRKIGSIYHEQAHEEWDEWNEEKAVELFLKQIELDPKKFSGYKCLSSLYLEMGKKKKIDALLKKYIETDPDNPVIYIETAELYYEMGSKRKGDNIINRAEKRSPNDSALLIKFGKAIFDISMRRAKIFFDKAIKYAEDKTTLYLEIGSWIGHFNPKMAIFYLSKYIEHNKEDGDILLMLAMLYGEIDDKIKLYKFILEASKIAKQNNYKELIDRIDSIKECFGIDTNIIGEQLSLL